MKKYLLIIALLSLLPTVNYAQLDLDYEDDINPYFLGDSSELVFPLLFDFFKTNSEHPAANIQLALIYEERYKQAHPISDYQSAIVNAEKAKLFFGRAKNLIDDREVRRNAWHYPNFTSQFKRNGKPEVEFDSVKVMHEKGLKEADSFLTYVPPIHKNFMKMVEQYDLASKNFVRINGEFTSLKDIYLLFNDELSARFDLVESSYDSTLYYFKQYKEAVSDYPPVTLNQQLSFNEIKTYRLDGLVIQTEFLVDDIELWDYASWVKRVEKVIDTEIAQLRTDIVKIENKLKASFSEVTEKTESDSIDVDPVERKSIYKIRKYDLNSPVANLFQYKDNKLDLVSERKSLDRYDTAQEISFQVKLYTINRVFQKTISLESELEKYNAEVGQSDLNKNKDFYDQFYGGIDSFKKYFKSEADELLEIRRETAKKLKSQIIYQLESPFLKENPKYKSIKFEWRNPEYKYDSFPKDIGFINFSASNVNDLEYFSGYYLNPDSVPQGFVGAKKGDEVQWYKSVQSQYKTNKAWQSVNDINVVGGGDLNYLLYESHIDSLDFANQIIILDETGKLKNQIDIDSQEKPVELVTMRNTSLQLALYQGDGLGDAIWPKDMTVVKFHPDSSNYSIKEISVNGKYKGIFQTEAGIIIASASEDGKTLYTSLFDNEFNQLKSNAFNFSEEFDIHYSYQISENSLHLLNLKAENGHVVLTDKLDLRYSDIPLVSDGI